MSWQRKPNEDVQVGDVTYWLDPDHRQRTSSSQSPTSTSVCRGPSRSAA